MSRRLEFFYDFSCPYAYLASTQIEALARRTGAELVPKPFLLGGVWKALGDAAGEVQKLAPARARMNALDMHRWAEHWDVPLVMPPGHPNRTVTALRAALASDRLLPASHALFRAYWAEGRDLSDRRVVSDALERAGLPGAQLVERSDEPALKAELRERTDEAIARGVFGAPACFVDGELYWGQDRLDFVERALGGEPESKRWPRTGDRAPVLEVWYDFSSPFAYLGWARVRAVAERAGAKLVEKPFLLGALFKSVGTADVPLMSFSPPKQRHYHADLMRFSARYGVPFQFPSHFPLRSVLALRVALAAGADIARATEAIFRAVWAEDVDVESPESLRGVLARAGLSAELVERASDDSVKLALRQNTDQAVALGLCGAPSFRVGDVVFWGQDRLAFVERALAGWRPRVG